MIEVKNISVLYDKKIALNGINLSIKEGAITTIIGPNGCGKSTLLKCISKNLNYQSGSISIYGKDLKKIRTKELSKSMALLPQTTTVPLDFTVKELVGFGRFPFVKFGRRFSKEDYRVMDWALEKTDMKGYKCRRVSTLSGGERQRVWIAMALAQEPEILLLDEPTTYLDIAHQFEVLELVKEINRKTEMTIVMVLHDINHAARYSDEVVVLNNGKVFKQGAPSKTVNEGTMEMVFSLKGKFLKESEYPHFVPEKSYR